MIHLQNSINSKICAVSVHLLALEYTLIVSVQMADYSPMDIVKPVHGARRVTIVNAFATVMLCLEKKMNVVLHALRKGNISLVFLILLAVFSQLSLISVLGSIQIVSVRHL